MEILPKDPKTAELPKLSINSNGREK